MFNYQRGDLVPASWSPVALRAGGGVISTNILFTTTLNIKGHNLKLSALLIDVTNSGTGGTRARISGVNDFNGTLNMSYDLDIPHFNSPPLLVHGQPGVAVFGLDPAHGIQVPMSCEEVGASSAVDKEVLFDVTMKANALAGVLVYQPLP